MKAINVAPTRGDFGLPDAAIIKPGDPCASTLYFRMAKFGRDRMPHIGSEQPDEAGLKLVERWIAGMDGRAESVAAPAENSTYDQLLANPKSALQLARRFGQNDLKATDRDALLAAALKLPPGPIRDLFEGYLPVDEKGERKLGSNPRPKVILALKGDARAGEEIFWSKAVDCGKCHRVAERGAAVGPDLSVIGKLRSRDELLESLLAPSRRVDPKYAQYIAKTTSGQSVSGVLIKRDAHAVVLRDGQGKDTATVASEIEELRPLRTSLMPDGQMAGLTAQQAADLLEYLATRNSGSSVTLQ
jgi:putative heme-binding domain-containing protein